MEHEEWHDPIEWESLDMPRFLLFGSVISVSCDLWLYPCELIKTRLQTQGSSHCSFNNYSGVKDAFQTIIKQEGARGLYKGFLVTTIGYIPAEIIFYSVLEYAKYSLKQLYITINNFTSNVLPDVRTVEPAIYLISGGIAEICSASVWIPCDIIQVKLMVQGPIVSKRTYSGGIDVIKNVWKEDGIRGFYRGSFATCLSFSCYSAVNWMVYEKIRRFLFQKTFKTKKSITTTKRNFVHMASGAVSGAVAATVTTPLDVIKTRLQVHAYHSRTSNSHEKASVRNMFRSIVKNDGYKGLWRGLTARIMYNAPVTSITLVTYEFIKRIALKEESK